MIFSLLHQARTCFVTKLTGNMEMKGRGGASSSLALFLSSWACFYCLLFPAGGHSKDQVNVALLYSCVRTFARWQQAMARHLAEFPNITPRSVLNTKRSCSFRKTHPTTLLKRAVFHFSLTWFCNSFMLRSVVSRRFQSVNNNNKKGDTRS